MHHVLRLLLLICLGTCQVLGQEHVEEEQEQTGLSALQLPNLNLSDGFVRAVGTAGVLVTAVAGFAALLSFILPLFGFRTCALLGTCDSGYDAAGSGYSAAGMAANSVYDQQQYTGYQYPSNAFRKRSLEYVGPILKALSTAYDKYGPKPKASNISPVETAKSTAK